MVKKIVIISIVLAVVIIIAGWAYYVNRKEANTRTIKGESEIINTIQDALKNDTSFKNIKDGIKHLSKEIDIGIPNVRLEISIYKFNQYKYIIKEAYEGGEWERNLREEKKEHDKLTYGVYYNNEKTIIIGSYIPPFIVKNIGNQKYQLFNIYYGPSGELSRLYITYVDDIKIEISLTFPLYEHPEIEYDYENQKITYPKQTIKIFSDIEGVIGKVVI